MNAISLKSSPSDTVALNPQPLPPIASPSASLWDNSPALSYTTAGVGSAYDDIDGYPRCGNEPHWPHVSSLNGSSAVGSAAFEVDDIPYCGNGPHGPLPRQVVGGFQALY